MPQSRCRFALAHADITPPSDICVLGAVEHRNLVSTVSAISGAAAGEILAVFSPTHGAGLMGLDHERLTFRYAGRDVRLADVHGVVWDELIG